MTPTHHANLIPYAYSDIANTLHTELGDVELVEIVEQTLPIERARDIVDIQLMKSGDRDQVIIVAFDTATREAQNALLKVLEEPVPSTFFYIITPNAHLLLPTLKSRLSELAANNRLLTAEDTGATKVRAFLKASPQKRLVMIKRLVDEKDRQGTAHLIKNIATMFESLRGSIDSKTWAGKLRELNTLLGYAQDPASSPKMLLEHVALTLPII